MPHFLSRTLAAAVLVGFAAVAFQRHTNNNEASHEFIPKKYFDQESSAPMNIGLVISAETGHCNPGTTIGKALEERGHHVTIISTFNAASCVQRAGLDFIPISVSKEEEEIVLSGLEDMARSHGAQAFQYAIQAVLDVDRMMLREVPGIVQVKNFDFMIIDEVKLSCASIAERHNIQFGVISNGVPFLVDPLSPPYFTPWQPAQSWMGAVRIMLTWLRYGIRIRSIILQANSFRKELGLGGIGSDYKKEVPSFWLAQVPRGLNFPYKRLPGNFVHTTPWYKPDRDQEFATSFPWEKLDGRPILYVSLGTMQNRIDTLFVRLAEACMDLDVQLVMTLGRRGATLEGSDTTTFPKGAIVVDYAPQVQLLERATALVTHAGMNTALEALSYGLPMLALPVNTDQPGVAARLAFAGAAEVVRPDETASSAVLREALERILTDPRYRQAAEKLRDEIRRGPTLEQVAELVEIGFSKGLSDDEAFNVRPEVVRIVGEPPPEATMTYDSLVVIVAVAMVAAIRILLGRRRGVRKKG